MHRRLAVTLYCIICAAGTGQAQGIPADSAKIADTKTYSFALGGDAKSALRELASLNGRPLSTYDSTVKSIFEARFKHDSDRTAYLVRRRSPIDPLLRIYRDYWRVSLLNPGVNYDSLLKHNVIAFLSRQQGAGCGYLNSRSAGEHVDSCMKSYIRAAGLMTTGFGKTGKCYDLLVWRKQKDTTYTFALPGIEPTSTRIVMMDSFLTIGWEEYATLGRSFPGGWATKEALYCVSSAYNLSSEEFLVSYLAHESRHFADYKLFPRLSTADLEYRAKLTELSLANESLWRILAFFISNAGKDSSNAHGLAGYCVVRDLSRRIFQSEFEENLQKWQHVTVAGINKVSYQLLRENTASLEKEGRGTAHFIKL